MQLNLFQNIINEIEKIDVNEFINEIKERLEKMEEELVIDRFEGNIAVCEDRKTGKKKEILKENLEKGLKEGDIIKEKKGKYVQANELQEETEKRIEEKMKKLWNN